MPSMYRDFLYLLLSFRMANHSLFFMPIQQIIGDSHRSNIPCWEKYLLIISFSARSKQKITSSLINRRPRPVHRLVSRSKSEYDIPGLLNTQLDPESDFPAKVRCWIYLYQIILPCLIKEYYIRIFAIKYTISWIYKIIIFILCIRSKYIARFWYSDSSNLKKNLNCQWISKRFCFYALSLDSVHKWS